MRQSLPVRDEKALRLLLKLEAAIRKDKEIISTLRESLSFKTNRSTPQRNCEHASAQVKQPDNSRIRHRIKEIPLIIILPEKDTPRSE